MESDGIALKFPWPQQHVPSLDRFKSPALWAKFIPARVLPSQV